MTPELKKLIFDYVGWKTDCDCGICSYCNGQKNINDLDGNDMVAAMEAIREKDEKQQFENYCLPFWFKHRSKSQSFLFWLTQPANFFNLMGKALEEGVIGK
jgi:hypothetical protein